MCEIGANMNESDNSRGDPMPHPTDLKVFISSREATCDECGNALGRRAWISLLPNKEAL